MKKLIIILISTMITIASNGQDCNEFYNFSKYTNCLKCIKANYKQYHNPKHTIINLKDTLTYNIVFYGGRDYMISFCADQQFYPLHIRLINPENMEVFYDNSADYYLESIGVGVYNTQNLILEVIMLANNINEDRFSGNEKVCMGMILQWKKILSKSNKLYLRSNSPS